MKTFLSLLIMTVLTIGSGSRAFTQQLAWMAGADEAGPFDFSQYDTLKYDLNPISAQTQDSVGATIENNDGIYYLFDNETGDTLQQTSQVWRPIWKETGGPNSSPSVYHDGVNDVLDQVTGSLWTCDSASIYFLVKLTTQENLFEYFWVKGNTSTDRQIAFGKGNNSVTYGPYGVDIRSSGTGGSTQNNRAIFRDGSIPTSWGLCSVLIDEKNDIQKWWLDGTEITVKGYEVGGTYGIYDATTKLSMGSGGSFSGSVPEFEWARLLIYSGLHDTTTREAIEDALSDEYNLGL